MPVRSKYAAPLPDCSLASWLFESPTCDLSDAPILIDPLQPDSHFLSLRSYRNHAQRLAAGLRRAGLQTGDRVMLVSPNSLAFPIVYMATIMAGGVFTPANWNGTSYQISYQASDTECKFLLTSPATMSNVRSAIARKDVPVCETYLVDVDYLFRRDRLASPTKSKVRPWSDLFGDDSEAGCFDWSRFYTGPDQVADIYYTSGSTGLAKGVMASHRNLIANSEQYIAMQRLNPDYEQHTAALSWIGWMPMAFVFGRSQQILIGPKRRIPNFLMDSLNVELMMSHLERYRITEIFGNPPLIVAMVNSPVARLRNLSSLQSAQIGGAPIKRNLCRRFTDLVGNPRLKLQQAWGMTEVTCIALHFHPLERDPSDSVGELLPNCEAKIMSLDERRELGPNERGELWVRAPNVTLGYWQKPVQTRDTYRHEGWLRSGDLAYYDEKGQWRVLDRIRNLISTARGQEVVPSEIESLLLDIPGVVNACVVGVPSSTNRSYQKPRAYVVLSDACKLQAEDINGILHASLPPEHQMTAGVFTISEIPTMIGGKTDRLRLTRLEVHPLSSAFP